MAKRKTGKTNPDSRFSDDIIEELLEALRDGRSMREICNDKRMPSRETLRIWCKDNEELDLAITRAREEGFYDRGERAVNDAKTASDPAKGRLAFDAERWFLGKVSRAFADKPINVDQSGAITINILPEDAAL